MNSNIKKQFPQTSHCKDIVYLDSASTTLKLQVAIDRVQNFYLKETSNIHRGIHALSSEATSNYEKSRETVAHFLSAKHVDEIIFTKGVTDGINLLASCLEGNIQEGDEIVISEMEHHSNYLPWIMLAQKKRAHVKFIPVTPSGELDIENLDDILSPKVKILSLVHESNSLGTINPVEEIIKKASEKNIITIIDAAQSVSVVSIDVQKINCDFLLFSGHKLFSPSGVGVLYGKKSQLQKLPVYQTGGGMVADSEKQIWSDIPHQFEAGTPPIEGVLGLAASIDYLNENISFEEVSVFEKSLLGQAESLLKKMNHIQIIGTSPTRLNILSFIVNGVHCDDVCQLLSAQNIAVRSGNHCCQPLMTKLSLPSGTIRASFSIYNTESDVEAFIKGVLKAMDILNKKQ